MARYALERIDSPDAVAAMRTALEKAPGARTQAGIIHSLARRRDATAVPALQKLMASSDTTVTDAAVNALGMVGTPEAEQALFAAKMTPSISAALFTLAEQAPADRARSIYTKLSSTSNADEIRVAAVQGLARRGAIDAVRKALQDSSPNVQTAAVVNLTRLDPASVTSAMETLAPAIRIQVLNAMIAQGDRNARSVVLAGAKNNHSAIRLAALKALAEVGSAEDVPALLTAASGSDPAEQAAARLALTRLAGFDVDAAIVSAVATASPKAKIELIRAVGERGSISAQDMLLSAAREQDPAIRRESLRALRGIARPEKAPDLLDLLLKSSDDDRKEIERALAAAIGRSEKPDVKPINDAFDQAKDSDTRASLVSVLAMTGEKDALPVLRKALAMSDVGVQRAAVTGLSEWTSPEPMDDLLRIARTSSDPSLKVLALRGYIRLVQRPAGRSAAETAKLLGGAMEAASRPDEKKAVLAAVQRVISPESLKIAQSATSDPAVAAEANLAASTLEKALSARGR
jgi:HEAT repeat protein